MIFNQLLNALGLQLQDDTVALKAGSLDVPETGLGSAIKSLLTVYFKGKSLVISDFCYKTNSDDQRVEFSGTGSFWGAGSYAVKGYFYLNEDHQAQLLLRQSLIPAQIQKNGWYFSKSFPQLPGVLDCLPESTKAFCGPLIKDASIPLDTLELVNAEWVMVSEDQVDTEIEKPLTTGINFIGDYKPHSVLALLSHLTDTQSIVNTYGIVTFPNSKQNPASYQKSHPRNISSMQFPWDKDSIDQKYAPGICLWASFDKEIWLIQDKLSLTLQDAVFYSPLSDEWVLANTNPMLVSTQAIRGEIAWPESDVSISVMAPVYQGQQQLALYGICHGMTLKKLESVMGVFGDLSSLESILPSPIKKALTVANRLQLLDFSLLLNSPVSGKSILNQVTLSIGIPSLNWIIVPKHLVAKSLTCHITFEFPSAVSVWVEGSVLFEGTECWLQAHSDHGFEISLSMKQGVTLPLGTVIDKLAPKLPLPGSFTVSRFRASMVSGQSYSLAMGLAATPDCWAIHVGPVPLVISDIAMGIERDLQAKTLAGYFCGRLEIASQVVDIRYDVPGPFQITWQMAGVKLSQLLTAFSQHGLSLPSGLDLDIGYSTVLVKEDQNHLRLELMSTISTIGDFAFLLIQEKGKWQVAVGLSIAGQSPADIPGLGVVTDFLKLFQLEDFILVASSYSALDFHFGDQAKVQLPLAKKGEQDSHKSKLASGVSLYARWCLSGKNKHQKLLQNFLGVDPTLAVILQLGEQPEKDSRLFVDYQATVSGHPLDCQFGAQWQDGDLGLFLSGSWGVPVQGNLQNFMANMIFVENGAFISASMTGDPGVKFGSLMLADLSLEVGISLEGIPSLGIAATLVDKRIAASFAMFFDSAEPEKSLLAGSISPVSVQNVLETFVTGKKGRDVKKVLEELKPVLSQIQLRGTHQFSVSSDLVQDIYHRRYDSLATAFKEQGGIDLPTSETSLHLIVMAGGKQWALTDLTTLRHYQLTQTEKSIEVSLEPQFYCAPQATQLGAQRFPEGFFLNASLSFLGFDVLATVTIDDRQGIAIDAMMDPVHIGNSDLLLLTGSRVGLNKSKKGKAKKGRKIGPQLSVSTFRQPKHPNVMFRNPHFYLSGCVALLGVKDDVLISVTSKGLEFDLKGELIKSVEFDIQVQIAGPEHLSVEGDVKVELGTIDLGILGKVKINTGAEAGLKISVHGQTISAELNVAFEALGKTHRIAQLVLNVNDSPLANLVNIIEKGAGRVIGHTAHQLLNDLNKAQKKVDHLSVNIKKMRQQVKKEQQQNSHAFNVAKAKVTQAQRDLNSISKQVKNDNAKIKKLKKCISDKKKWANHGNIFTKAKRGIEFTAFAVEKNAEMAGLSTAIAGLIVAQKTAQGVLEVAKQSLRGLESAAKIMPVDSDPRVATLISAKAVATAEISVIKAPLKALAA